jgi:hypothetical protein
MAPISKNLKRGLAPHHQDSGPVAGFANCSKQLLWLVDDIRRIHLHFQIGVFTAFSNRHSHPSVGPFTVALP